MTSKRRRHNGKSSRSNCRALVTCNAVGLKHVRLAPSCMLTLATNRQRCGVTGNTWPIAPRHAHLRSRESWSTHRQVNNLRERKKPSSKMKTKMCICGFLALAISSACILLGEEPSRGGIVNGPKAGFNIAAPNGWVLDTESGKHQDLPCVLYPKASSWSDAKTVMYAKVASPQWEGVNAFVAWAIKGMEKTHGIPKEKIASGKTKDGH